MVYRRRTQRNIDQTVPQPTVETVESELVPELEENTIQSDERQKESDRSPSEIAETSISTATPNTEGNSAVNMNIDAFLDSSQQQADNEVSRSVIQVIQPIKAPALKSFSRLALVEFRMAHDRYIISAKANGVKGRTPLECLDPNLLVVLSKQYLQKETPEITDVDLEQFIEQRLAMDVHFTEERMKKIFATVKMDLGEPDAIQRVTLYNMKYLKTMAENGLDQLEHQNGFRKQVVALLLEGVRPSSLRQLMRQKTKTSDARNDPRGFFDLLEQWTPLQDVFHMEKVKTVNYEKNRKMKSREIKRHPMGRSKDDKPQFNKGRIEKNKRKLACLICGRDNHRTNEHRGATKEVIDKAFQDYRDKKAAVSTESVHTKSCCNVVNIGKTTTTVIEPAVSNEAMEGSSCQEDIVSTNGNENKLSMHMKALNFCCDRQLPKVKINGSIEVSCLLDSGTDHPVICRDIVDRLAIESYRLTSPLRCELPMEPNKSTNVICKERTTLDLAITLPELPEKPLMCSQVQFLVADVHMPVKVLLGRSFLKDLGVDVDKEVARIANERPSHTYKPKDITINESTTIPEPTSSEEHDFQSNRDLNHAIEAMITRAFLKGMNRKYEHRLRSIVKKFDIWRTKLGPDLPAKVPPLKLKLKPGTPFIKAANRRYPPMYREFMNKRLSELEKYGLVYRNNNSRYGSAVHVVPKVEMPTNIDTDLRWTVDLREINKWIEAILWPMPNLEVVSECAGGAKVYASFDFLKGYWQMPLEKESQEILSMMTDMALYSPTRVPQGLLVAVMYFQSTMQNCFQERLYKSLIIWIDDVLCYSNTVVELLENIEYIFKTCHDFGLKLNPDKCELYTTKVKFCGKLFSASGIAQDPERVASITSMPTPRNAAELQQYLCALNWMRNHIPDFARLCKPLRRVLEQAAKGTTRKSKQLKGIPINLSDEDLQHYETLNKTVAKSALLAHPSQEADFFLFTDASDDGWGSVLFQVQDYKKGKPMEKQNPEPLSFLSGSFVDAQYRWSIPEKEAYAIVESVERLDYMLIRPKPFYIMTDHKNLTFIFASNTHLKKATRHKISRWALTLCSFNYEIEHIDGVDNVWADLLSRWGQQPARKLHVKALTLHPFDEGSDFVFPSLEDIWESQRKTQIVVAARKDLETRLNDGYSYIYHNNKPWIPEDDKDLLHRILVVAHCGIAGHRGVASTTRAMQNYCSTLGLRTKVLDFMKLCLLCLQTKGGKIIPRPLGRTLQAEAPNEVLHFDFYYVGDSNNDWQYVLVLKDGLSHFVELVGCKTTDSLVVVEALLDWFKRYGIVPTWVSDQPTHYKNSIISTLTKRLKSCHHFVTAYCPWANGTIERVNRDLGTLFRSILAEFKLPLEHWPQVLPIVQYVLNQTPTDSLHGYSAIQIFMGREPSLPITEIFNPATKTFTTVEIDSETLRQHYNKLRSRLESIHKETRRRSDQIHDRNVRNHRASHANFSIGDYVLWSRVDEQATQSKLQFIWRGPFKVVGTCSDYVFVIEHLTTRRQYKVHASRLKFYHDKSLAITTDLEEHVDTQGFLFDVDALKDFHWNTEIKQWEFRVSWKGFEESEDTWEPFTVLLKDIPQMLHDFLKHTTRIQERKRLIRKHKKLIAKSKYCKALLSGSSGIAD